ncbi:hypothetical protein D918_04462 [Trichuris suis]|nr:hypothetical protein D918_04462 [Trichuris suis]
MERTRMLFYIRRALKSEAQGDTNCKTMTRAVKILNVEIVSILMVESYRVFKEGMQMDIEGVWENVEEECKERCAMCLFFDCFCIGQEYKRCLERCKSEKGAVVAKQLKTSNRFK